MNILRLSLFISTILIYSLTVLAISKQGFNWPAVAYQDLMSLDWRSQFDFDFIVHLLLLASWVTWREGASTKGYCFGFLSVVMGGMFSFPYLIYISIKARGNVPEILLGVHGKPPILTSQ